MSNKIVEALLKLDVKNDNHWTADKLPRLDTVKMLASDQSITRDQISESAPGFHRDNAANWVPTEKPVGNVSTTETVKGTPAPGAQLATEAEGALVNATPSTAATNAATGPVGGEEPLPAKGTVAQLEEALRKQEAEVQQLRKRKIELDRLFEAARSKEDEIRTVLDSARPKVSDGNGIQEYLASQRKVLEERARRKLADKGNTNPANIRAPIDAQRARNKP